MYHYNIYHYSFDSKNSLEYSYMGRMIPATGPALSSVYPSPLYIALTPPSCHVDRRQPMVAVRVCVCVCIMCVSSGRLC